jgi:hypothetical protein
MNTTAKIKTAIITLGALLNLILPPGIPGGSQGANFFFAIACLIFGALVIPVIIKFNSLIWLKEIVKPKWNDNPLRFRNPLVFFHFGGWFFVVIGVCIMIGDLIKYHELNPISMENKPGKAT